jgi:predicted DNA-binding transcriptional regulator YafY
MSKLAHLAEIMIILQYKNFVTASELSEVLGVDKKTIYRYIETLALNNIPIVTKKGRNGGFSFDGKHYMKQPNLSRQEVEALILASDILTKKKSFFYEQELKSAVRKIRSMSKEYLETKFKVGYIESIEDLDEIFSKITYAVENCRTIELSYFNETRNDLNNITIDPYTIFYKNAEWHLIGLEHNSDKIKSFEVRRINEIKATNYIFMKRSDFSLEIFIKECWSAFYGDKIRVVLKFDKELKQLILNCKWHSSQQIECLEDESTLLKLFVDDLVEIKRWAMSFGTAVEVIEPIELRNEIKEEVIKLKKLYDSK